jgi:hypothetical protein
MVILVRSFNFFAFFSLRQVLTPHLNAMGPPWTLFSIEDYISAIHRRC